MGQFSWIYSDTNEQLLDDVKADAYLLVPKPFQKEYGKAIHESGYDGYGHFGKYDVYDLVALWNRDYFPSETRIVTYPEREKYVNDDCYELSVKIYKRNVQMGKDFVNYVSDTEMKEKYGKEYLREIGINIACFDEDNEKLKYPIKITTKEMEYENVKPSKSDPNQGWYYSDYDGEEDW